LNDVYTVLPFQDDLIILEVEGQRLYDMMEASYSYLGTTSGGFLQISGMTVTYDPSAEIGSRVVSIRVDGSEVDPEGLYTICTTDYLAKGGDGNTALTGYAYAGVGDNAMALSMYLLRLEIIKESDIQIGRQTAVEVFDAQNSLMGGAFVEAWIEA
jgi:2',3'-cyclic-nucleotide 2'-phosphodiesterase (5'-nucleotidase family)